MSVCNLSQFPYNWTSSQREEITTQDVDYESEFCITAGEDFSDEEEDSKPLREKNSRKGAHVPHRDKPPQVVARRNARERRRVQAVNGAFMKLRKAVPFENHRGKRISKVKTLQNAIEYIQNLEDLLRKEEYESINFFTKSKPTIQEQFQVFHRGYYRMSQDEFMNDFGYDIQYRRNNNFIN